MAAERYLIDTSAFARLTKPAVRHELGDLSGRGLLATCAMVEMELLFSARSPVDSDNIRRRVRSFEWLTTPDDVWERATQVQCELIKRGEHRTVKIPDLLIAATAERHRVSVLHYDHDFDRIAAVTEQPTRWVVPRGEAD